jgi:hypothetical protein
LIRSTADVDSKAPVGQIPESVEKLSNSLQGLEEGLAELIRRLGSALRPSGPREGTSVLKAAELKADLAETLSSFKHSVDSMYNQVRDALDRLEL